MERTGLIVLAISVLLIVSSGCARMNSIQRNVDLSTTSIAIDAEQRVVISVPSKPDEKARIVCAEPSPDVFKIRGGSFSGLLEKAAKQDLELALSAAEAGQNIGLRTQSIQLLRDAMYRACEGAAGGMLEPKDFAELQTRFQKLTAVLLATEQLTGAVRPVVAPILTTGGSANTGVGLVEIQNDLDAARKEETRRQSVVEAQEKKTEGAGKNAATAAEALEQVNDKTPEDEKAKLTKAHGEAQGVYQAEQSALAEAQRQLADASANRLALEQKRQAARSAATTAGGGAVFVAVGDPARQLDPRAAETVAKVVKDMVIAVFEQDSGSQRCVRAYIDAARIGREARAAEVALSGAAEIGRIPGAEPRRIYERLRSSPLAVIRVPPDLSRENLVAEIEQQTTAIAEERDRAENQANVLEGYCQQLILLEGDLARERQRSRS